MSFFDDISDFFSGLGDRIRGENEDIRREERELEISLEDAELDTTSVEERIKVLSVDLQGKENARRHHCDRYELITLSKRTSIVRRGGSLTMTVELNQVVDLKHKQELTIYFNYGPRPLVNKGTQAVLKLTGKKLFDKESHEWDHRVVKEDGKKVELEVHIPYDVPIGIWMVILQVKPKGASDPSLRHIKRLDQHLYILFNPWNKKDEVYMKEEEKREEYVLNDVGKIWVGSYPLARGREWVFGQFDDAVLPACVLLLEKANVAPEQRGDPITVSRAISRIVNSNDDNGVVVGRWQTPYDDGTSPAEWTGSISILEKYLKTNKPVKYGQCWVFSGVTTTVCRALGLPSRSVSNLNSAHDTNQSLTIDKYFDEDGEKLKPGFGVYAAGIDDSIWNFHVWNDVWMARPDLPPGYGGWQAIDATPQEQSQGLYQCGPASLEAIRSGKIDLNYDVSFVMAEVNADVVHWQKDKDSRDGFKKLTSNKQHVGRQVLTKKAGKLAETSYIELDKEDCTSDYKPREGSQAERITLHNAARRTRAARHAFRFPSVADEDVEFELEDIERVKIGEDYTIRVKAKNTSDSIRTVKLLLSSTSEYYTGVKAHLIVKAEGEFTLNPTESTNLKIDVPYTKYYDKLVEYSMMRITGIASVKETTQTWVGEDTFQVIKPSLKIDVEKQGQVGKPLSLNLSFKNPLDKDLKECTLVIDGPGLTRPKRIPLQDIPGSGKMSHKMNIYPKRTGSRAIMGTFNSFELIDVTGSNTVDILG